MITGTSAKVSLKAVPDFRFGWFRVIFKDIPGRHDHARGAKTALQPMVLLERFLDRVHLIAIGHTFNCNDITPIGLHRQNCTGFYGTALHGNRTCPATTGIATYMSACEFCVLPDIFGQTGSWFYIVGILFSIDRY
jgi:hypothetical protein